MRFFFEEENPRENGLQAGDVTRILSTLSDSDRSTAAELLPQVYQELRQLAGQLMENERTNHTLQPTALVHEAYVRLVHSEPRTWGNRGHFFRVAAGVMRHVLVDHARRRNCEKRGAGNGLVPLDDIVMIFEERAVDLLALDDALEKLAGIDKRKARVVELRFFAGLSVEETAQTLDISPRAVKGDWQFAKLWLLREIAKE